MPFTFTKLEIPDLVLASPRVFNDERGFFLEGYKESDFKSFIGEIKFVQDNHSMSSKGVVRGLHYQLNPKAQGKLVRVVKGAVFDVAVDIRKNSPTFMRWVAVELNAVNNSIFWIPPGFAHGFAALEDDTHLLYKCTSEYDPSLDQGIRWDDPDICVNWPFADPLVSGKDKSLPFLKDAVIFDGDIA